MAKLHDFKVQGQTAADVAIATATVEYHDDGTLRFTTAAGEKVRLQPTADLNKLFKLLFVGTGGVATGKAFFGI